MTRKQKSTLARRTLLSAVGTGLAGLIGSEATAKRRGRPQYVLVQGDSCVPVQPITGQLPANTFYNFQLPEEYVAETNGAFVGDTDLYSSAGTRNLQQPHTSIAFLYRGPRGVSLVVVHGSVHSQDGGAVTFQISGLPEDGEWIVKDDFYRNPATGEIASSNFDRWNDGGADHRIDWTWGSASTDGGVFHSLGNNFEVIVHPAFNEAATLYNEHYEGTITDWEFLSGPTNALDRVSLSLDEPVRVATGRCEGNSVSRRAGQQTGQQEQEERRRENEKGQEEQQQNQQKRQESREERQEERKEEQEERREENREKQEERQEKQEERREERQEEREEEREERQEDREERREERQEDGDDEGEDSEDDEDGEDDENEGDD